MNKKIKVAIAGVGNCASALVQGIEFYRKRPEAAGLMHREIGGYRPEDIEVVAAFDIDRRKVGKKLKEAILSKPNCTTLFVKDLPDYPVVVQMGPVLDGVSDHVRDYDDDVSFSVADVEPCDVVDVLRTSGADILINYLPVGSEKGARFYAEACLKAKVGFINAMPTFIVSDPEWSKRFEAENIPAIGDDIKSQLGATIVHRVLTDLFEKRGVKLTKTYQLNFGGNTDFLNMLNSSRLTSKKKSKTNAVQSQLNVPLPPDKIHIGPSDYVPWLKDNKICYIFMEGLGFGEVPLTIEVKLSVEDSPNSAGVIIDAIRCLKVAQDRGIGGPLTSVASFTMKSPPQQYTDSAACKYVEEFIAGKRER
ncbi:Inositol-3-phosphate synthase [Koleobacter methoxysyntrophicus]|uniref:Inositol-3-phosphate synthase n=1 Tax=Koleobacter methoxysyntrophicus TaxID=2751313 RepID=A0A8A0RJM2_9FIRM|nr:inositol-3-phosphate synthase [Koleobacter methoxysyntrophicus]QSQ07840.1 Inositol-3-phosphate synthase [Koleobacter methoxysyntrophicus]